MRRPVLSKQTLSFSTLSEQCSLAGSSSLARCVLAVAPVLLVPAIAQAFGVSGSAQTAGVLAASSALAQQAQQSFPVQGFTARWHRQVGLPEFEDPVANVKRIREACDEYLKAVGGVDRAGILAAIPLTPIGTDGLRAAVIRKPESEKKPFEQCGPADFVEDSKWVDPREITRIAKGVYKHASDLLSARARAWRGTAEAATADETLRKAVSDFETAVNAFPQPLGFEDDEFKVRLRVLPGGIVWFESTREAAPDEPKGEGEVATVSLATLAGNVDPASLPNLARQIEAALEARLSLLATDQGKVELDYSVAALKSGNTVELVLAFVGPKASPAIPVSRFSLIYRGGDGSELNVAERKDAEAGQVAGDGSVAYDLPTPSSVLAATSVRLFRVRAGEQTYLTDFAPGAADEDAVDLRLDTVFEKPEMLSIGAVQTAFEAVSQTLQKSADEGGVAGGDLIGAFADADAGQLDLTLGARDARKPEANNEFRIKVVPGVVNSVRARPTGERAAVEADALERIESGRFRRLVDNAPFQPKDAEPQVLRESVLRDYLDRQSRHPNRRVDAAITAAESPSGQVSGDQPQWNKQGTVGLDFLVTENKPWSVILQGSNTGVDSTGEWQFRAGFFHSDVFGNDEIFSFEYVTTNLSDSNAFTGYFDAPVGDSETLRWKLFAGYSQYTASDVGFALATFEGESTAVGAELSWNVAQWGKTFLDIVGGVSWTDAQVYNGLTDDTGNADFLVPTIGARLQRNNRDAVTDFSVNFDYGTSGGASRSELNRLGRLFANDSWQAIRWDLVQSFYIDSLFQDSSDGSNGTLAHELYFRLRGQNSFGNRLVPQFMGTAGGFYTVRGYPTSFVAGDNLYLATAEYRLHIPQLLGFDENPQPFLGLGTEPFRLRPQFGYGPTDWDLIVRGFIDAGIVENVDRRSFELDQNLVGVGVGVELQLYKGLGYPTLRNMSLRTDIGFPLDKPDFTDIDGLQVTFVGTLSF